MIARDFLRDDGVIFISIDDNEVTNLRKICDEVFGEENFVGQVTVLCNPKGRSQDKYLATCHEYLLIFSKSEIPKGALDVPKSIEDVKKEYPLKNDKGRYRELELRNTHRDFGKHNRPNLYYPFYITKDSTLSLNKVEGAIEIMPDWNDGFKGCWTWGKEKAYADIQDLVAKKVNGNYKVYRNAYAAASGEVAKKQLKSIWEEKRHHTEKGQTVFNNLFNVKEKLFQSPKSLDVLKDAISMTQDKNAIVLDFFSGSATTAHAVKVFKIDSSNMKDVYYNPKEIDQRTLTNLRDNIKEDRTEEDLLFQVLLELALPISAKVREEKANNKTIYRVNDNFLIACFDDDLDLKTIKIIAEHDPLRIVFKDSSFKDDATKVNCDEYLKNKLPNTIVKVI
jgi:adenine-specific DNA-methyltransferase